VGVAAAALATATLHVPELVERHTRLRFMNVDTAEINGMLGHGPPDRFRKRASWNIFQCSATGA